MVKVANSKSFISESRNYIIGGISIPPIVVRGQIEDSSIRIFDKFAYFPGIGDSDKLYIDKENNLIYRWDSDEIRYVAVGNANEEIKFIDGGTL